MTVVPPWILPRRRTLFSVLAWAAATSGDPHLAPLVRATPRGSQLRQDIAQARYQARALPTHFPAVLARSAENYGAGLTASIDRMAATPAAAAFRERHPADPGGTEAGLEHP